MPQCEYRTWPWRQAHVASGRAGGTLLPMDIQTTPAQPPTATPVEGAGWLELAGPAALDPAQQARVERWLQQMFGDEPDEEPTAH